MSRREDTGTIYREGPYGLTTKATGVMCPDGTRRTVALMSSPDTYFSYTGRLKYRGTTVTGVVMHRGNDTDENLDLGFTPQGKNRHIFENNAAAIEAS